MLNETEINDIWSLINEFVDKEVIDETAERYVDLLVDHNVTDKTLNRVMGADPILDQAIEYYLEQDDEEEEEEDSFDELVF
jgi:hypothetical protein